MPHPTHSTHRQRLTPRSTGLLQKFFTFIGREPEAAPPHDAPPLQMVIGQLRFHLANLRFPLEASAEDRLRAVVFSYVDVMKASAKPSEQVVIALKGIFREAGIESDRPTGESLTDSNRLCDRVVSWCIQRYYFGET